MANEFIARKGLIALSDSKVTGSLELSGDLSVVGGDIVLGTTSIFSGGDTTSLNNIDAIDATTEATIEAAIDTLANLTSIQGQTVTLGGAVTLAGSLVTQNNNVTINAAGATRTLTLTESLTIGDGNDGTITFSGASKTLTVEDTSVVNQDLTTDASPQFTAVNVGAASDTTVARASAGDINVEGNIVYRAGGTDVPVADGGTGASTAAAAATALGVGTGDSPQLTAVNVGHASDTTLSRKSAGVLQVEANELYVQGGTDVAVADGGTGASTLNNLITMGTHTTGDYVASLVAGTGVTLSNNSGETATPTVAIGQAVATTSNVTFDTGSFTGDVTITGNLLVQGATTQIQSSELKVEDKLITVASGSADSATANDAGIEIFINNQTNPSITWDHTGQQFDFNYPISGSEVTGSFTGSFTGDGSQLTDIASTLTTAGESGGGTVALKTQTLTVTGGEGIDTVAANQTITISGEDASVTNKGVVELATTAETNTGTDAARVVTPDGLNDWTGGAGAITKLGTIASGVWQGTTVAVDQGGTGATTLNDLITLTTHTTGNYVATITGGTGITSTAATSGEGTTHSLSVDAAQTQITSVGTLAAGAISSGFGAIDIGTSALSAGATTIDGALNESTTTSTTDPSAVVVATIAVASYSSAQFDYSINDGTNYRAGTVMVIWKAGASIDFTDYSTPDIGDTSGATFTVDESGGDARLKFTCASGTWSVKVITRAL